MNKTTNLELNKPTMTDFVSKSVEDVFGENFDIIDNEFSEVRSENAAHANNKSNPHKVTFEQIITSLPDDADLNELFAVGIYNVPDNTTNAPITTAGVMIAGHPWLNGNTYQNIQVYIPVLGENMVYRRTHYSNGWSAWTAIGSVSPQFSGTPTAPTASQGTNNAQIATTAFVAAAIAAIQITKETVGLGNVPNVTTNDQTPTYSAASTLATLSSGEKLSVSMGKIMLAITNLINHLANTSNPHSVTASQIGAAASSHNHSASNITSGTLPVTRGGTGITTLTNNDYTTSRVRGISLQSTIPTSISNGHIVGVYA